MATKDFGTPLPDWVAPPAPDATLLEGRYARLERLEERHAHALFRANAADDAIWDYLPYGPFPSEVGYIRWVKDMAALSDPYFFTVIDRETGAPGGVMSYLRITPAIGTIELGHICLSPQLQRSRAATEAMVLLMSWAFGSGYRRFEWKCDALNKGSRRAAQRMGFSWEGIFRQAAVVKGRNRDTAWFAMTDGDWRCLKPAWEAWLDPGNFDEEGRERVSLRELTTPCRVASDPFIF